MAGAAAVGLAVGKFGLGSGAQAQSLGAGGDPTFSANGVQFPSFTSDPGALAGNMWYRSDLTAMKYSDGASAHELGALDIVNTWTALQTFGNNISVGGAAFNVSGLASGNYLYYNGTKWVNVVPITGTTLTETAGQLALNLANANIWTGIQTLNGGIIFNAAGSIAGTSTYIEADGAGGNLILNAPTGNSFFFKMNNVGLITTVSNNFYPSTDLGLDLGQPSNRWDNVTLGPNGTRVLHAVNDANPSAVLGDGNLKFGAGGASALDITVSRLAASLLGISGGMVFSGVTSVSANYTALGTDFVVLDSASGAANTVTLPAANAQKGRYLTIIKTDSSVNAVTVAAAGADTIQGSASKGLGSQYSKITLVSDGSATWYDLTAGLV